MSENREGSGTTACAHERWHDTHHAGRLCDDCDEELDVPLLTEEEIARHKAEHEELMSRWQRFNAQQKAQREAIEEWNALPEVSRQNALLLLTVTPPLSGMAQAGCTAALAVLRAVVKP